MRVCLLLILFTIWIVRAKVVPQMEFSLHALMPEAYVKLIKIGLNESLTAAERSVKLYAGSE